MTNAAVLAALRAADPNADCTCGHHHGPGHHHEPHPPRPDALVSARGVSFARNGRSILHHVDLDVAVGEIVTLIGPNGAGKTSLVRILMGLLPPDEGRVTRRPDLVVGYVPQRFDLDRAVPVTVERFLTLSVPQAAGAVTRVLDEVGAAHVRQRQLFHLSGGELQRVLLARALVRRPNLLVLDEPARGVDYTGEAELYELIGRLRSTHGLGVLLVSHDIHVVMAKSDRVICLNQHVCCAGVPEHVASDPAYQELFGAAAARQLAVYRHHHDHTHDLSGHTQPLRPGSGPEA